MFACGAVRAVSREVRLAWGVHEADELSSNAQGYPDFTYYVFQVAEMLL